MNCVFQVPHQELSLQIGKGTIGIKINDAWGVEVVSPSTIWEAGIPGMWHPSWGNSFPYLVQYLHALPHTDSLRLCAGLLPLC